jgi:hypothetical protein
MSEAAIVERLRESGPLTGAELQEQTELEPLALWRFCVNDPRVDLRILGRRYLRLDRAVDGYARLSPSIRREFLTYTLLDRSGIEARMDGRAETLSAEIQRISEAKRRLATQTVTALVEALADREEILTKTCFILGGDIVYNMAHRVPRPEHSTGKLVRGSDLDIVIVTDDSLDQDVRSALDDAIYQRKYMLLISPSYREELDYLIKDLATVQKQVAFDTFEHMVACKILHEGEFLHGSRDIFEGVKGLLEERDIPRRLELLEERAATNRAHAEQVLRLADGEQSGSHYLNLFYTTDEGDEIY